MTVHNHPPYRPMCNERAVDGQLRGACLTDDGQPGTYLDPVRAEEAEARETAALKRAEVAEARVDQLTDQLTLANDTLRHRATAVNATGTSNDALRAKVARVEKVAADWDARAALIRQGEDQSGFSSNTPRTLTLAARDLREALADQEPAK